jgi:hypothetical protein
MHANNGRMHIDIGVSCLSPYEVLPLWWLAGARKLYKKVGERWRAPSIRNCVELGSSSSFDFFEM